MSDKNFSKLFSSINSQLALTAAICLSLAIATQSWYAAYNQNNIAHKTLTKKSISVANSIANNVSMDLFQNNYIAIEELIKSFATLEDVSQIQIIDIDGNVISEVNQEIGKIPTPIYDKKAVSIPNKFIVKVKNFDDVISIYHPIEFVGKDGWVKLDVNAESINRLTWQVWKNAAVVGILAVLSSIVLFVHLSQRSVFSIKKAADFSIKLNENRGSNVDLKAHSVEIKQLETALNSISKELMIQEKELLEYQNHLENQVYMRTQELELSNQELEAYSYSIAHDLRAPLRAISGFSSILKDEADKKLGTEEKDYLNRIITATANMDRLIDGILCMSRVTRQDIILKECNISKIANEITEQLAEQYKDKKIIWKIQQNIKHKCDEMLIGLLLENLFSNACKFTRPDTIATIELFTWPSKEENVIAVRDNGIGLDMKYAEKIFHPFQQLNDKSKYGGEGIGLATVKRIVQRHGSRIWVESNAGKNTTFFFTLPK